FGHRTFKCKEYMSHRGHMDSKVEEGREGAEMDSGEESSDTSEWIRVEKRRRRGKHHIVQDSRKVVAD
ncbi:hypothetical protein U1Q18_041102, partial [Sarracenia purpurea var. burkii]